MNYYSCQDAAEPMHIAPVETIHIDGECQRSKSREYKAILHASRIRRAFENLLSHLQQIET
jgi:hypothetical protein